MTKIYGLKIAKITAKHLIPKNSTQMLTLEMSRKHLQKRKCTDCELLATSLKNEIQDTTKFRE